MSDFFQLVNVSLFSLKRVRVYIWIRAEQGRFETQPLTLGPSCVHNKRIITARVGSLIPVAVV